MRTTGKVFYLTSGILSMIFGFLFWSNNDPIGGVIGLLGAILCFIVHSNWDQWISEPSKNHPQKPTENHDDAGEDPATSEKVCF